MIGRTPEYLGKKVQSYEVKMASFYLLIFAAIILGFSAWGALSNWGPPTTIPVTHVNGTNNNGPHGLTEILYAFSEAAGNNGSAFAGLKRKRAGVQHRPRHRHSLRPLWHVDPLPCHRRLAVRKKVSPPGPGSFPVHSPTFVILVDRCRRPRRRAQLPAGPSARPHRRALPDARRQTSSNSFATLTYISQNGCQITFHLRSHDCLPAIGESFKKLNPVHMVKNPVMFVTEVGAAITTVLIFTGTEGESIEIPNPDHPLALVHRGLRELRRSHGRRPRQGPGRYPAQDPHPDLRQSHCQGRPPPRKSPPTSSARMMSWSSPPAN
jgi:hypothetical protein